jgi:hypothetical protein
MTAQNTNNNPGTTKNAMDLKHTSDVKNPWNGNKIQTRHQSKTKFVGEIKELNGNEYELHNETSKGNQFQKTSR